LEGGVPDRIDHTAVCIFLPQYPRHHAAKKEHEPHIPAEFGIDFDDAPVALQHVVKEHERHAAQEHEEYDHPIKVGIVVMPDAGVPRRIAGC